MKIALISGIIYLVAVVVINIIWLRVTHNIHSFYNKEIVKRDDEWHDLCDYLASEVDRLSKEDDII